MITIHDELLKDMEAIKQISIVPTMLEVVCQTTGMGFAAVARVTQDRWLACSVRDEVQFGLKEGEELKIETTLCNEIRDSRMPIIIDNVAEDPLYRNHTTPNIYGLQSYISVPIILKNGAFFGTLCAVNPKPALVSDPKVVHTLTMFADLLSFHLQSLDLLERSHKTNAELSENNKALTNTNFELDSFVYTASHDLKSPLNNIESLIDILSEAVEKEQPNREEIHQLMDMIKTSIKRCSTTIKDLATVVEVDKHGGKWEEEEVNLLEIVETVKQDLHHQIQEADATIEVNCGGEPFLRMPKKSAKSIMHNLLSNAIKYRSPERKPEVLVRLDKNKGKVNLSVIDNGLGIPADNKDQVFTMFNRFHTHVEGTGLGLYIVKRTIDNIKGQIHVDSTLGKGTTFTVVI